MVEIIFKCINFFEMYFFIFYCFFFRREQLSVLLFGQWIWRIFFIVWLICFFVLTVFYCCSITIVPVFPWLFFHAPPTSPPLPQSIPHIVHAHESSIRVPLLVPSPSFPYYPPFPSPLVTVSLFFISTSLILFCSFVCFVD